MADDFKATAHLLSDVFVQSSEAHETIRRLMGELYLVEAAPSCFWDEEADTFVYSTEEVAPPHYRQMYYFKQSEQAATTDDTVRVKPEDEDK